MTLGVIQSLKRIKITRKKRRNIMRSTVMRMRRKKNLWKMRKSRIKPSSTRLLRNLKVIKFKILVKMIWWFSCTLHKESMLI